jgi:2-dehydropantoate 2-reductase
VKVCVYGAGAIGGYLAGRLAKGGADLSVVARGPHLQAVRAEGLTVRTADGVLHSRPAASDRPAELGPQDAVVVCTKVPALPSVAEGIGPLLGPGTAVAFVTNGIPWWYFDRHDGEAEGARIPEVDPGDAIRRAVGVKRTLGGVIYAACAVASPGVVEMSSRTSKLILGEPDGERSARAVSLASAFKAGGLPCSVSPDIRAEVWGKLLNNLANGPLCLLSRRNIRDTFDDPVLHRAALEAVEEGLAIAAAMGRQVSSTAEERIALSAQIPHKPSILQDLELGRPMEIDALFTVPLRLAREWGVPTPMLSLLVALATHAAEAAGLYRRG